MKRCPLCDFIYEDSQGVCDMDGIELVQDGGALIPVGKETAPETPAPARSPRRRRTLHLLLAFGLGAAVFSAYYTSVDQPATASGRTSASSAARPAPPVVEPTPAPVAPAPAATPVTPVEETKPAPAPSAPAAEPRGSGKKPRSGGANKKKESKLSSILNKTGRMLKKPFGF